MRSNNHPNSYLEKVGGVILTVKMQAKFPEYTWIVAAVGVVLDGCSCFLIPWCTNYFMLMMPICILCFGIAMVDTALLPTLGYIVDKVIRPTPSRYHISISPLKLCQSQTHPALSVWRNF